MTDAEIIKALGCCVTDDYDESCVKCPARKHKGCDYTLHKNALDLINRQKAEIEKHKKRCSCCGEKTTKTIINLQELLAEQKAEIERLTINMNAFGLGMKREKERADTAKSEAIKEFAERLKKAKQYSLERHENIVPVAVVDWIVKEMVGDTE